MEEHLLVLWFYASKKYAEVDDKSNVAEVMKILSTTDYVNKQRRVRK